MLTDLQKFLKTEKDELTLEITNPPLKKMRLQDLETGADNPSENGEMKDSVSEDESVASADATSRVCNVCLGVLQEFCEKEFIKKVNNLVCIIGGSM